MSPKARDAVVAGLLAIVSFAPFTSLLFGSTLFFRDLSVQFLPWRVFALEGLRSGQVRDFNPYNHEGVPLSLPAVGYPLDLLGLFAPDTNGVSLILALHIPLAAIAFFLLARGLGLRRAAAFGGGVLYALGGFALSSINLYVYAQAMAWAPLVILGLRLAGRKGGPIGWPAIVTGIAISTTGVEIVGQAVLWGLVLVESRKGLGRAVLAALLGAGLAAPVILNLSGQVPGSERAAGFATEVVLAHSVHPLSLVQTLVGNLFGNLHDIANDWWGQNFFPRGFPYVLSLYVGAVGLSCALVGATGDRPWKWRIVVAGTASLFVALGRYAGLEPLVDHLGSLRLFRFPVKGFFGVHLAVALLAAAGLHALAAGFVRRAWIVLLTAAASLASLLLAVTLVVSGPARSWFVGGFFPPDMSVARRLGSLAQAIADARIGAFVAILVAVVAALALSSRLRPRLALGLVLTCLAGDLLRTGAGLNPAVDPRVLRPSPEMQALIPFLISKGRVFTCDADGSPTWRAFRQTHEKAHARATFMMLADTLSPSFNMQLSVRTALSPDLTMLVPLVRTLPWEATLCGDVPSLVGKLREAGVGTVLALDRLEAPGLRWEGAVAPARIAPVLVHVYTVDSPRPRFRLLDSDGKDLTHLGSVEAIRDTPGRMDLRVQSPVAVQLAVGEGPSPGWQATIDGRPTPVGEREGRLLTLPVPQGATTITLRYVAPGRRNGIVLLCAAAFACGLLELWRRRSRQPLPKNAAGC